MPTSALASTFLTAFTQSVPTAGHCIQRDHLLAPASLRPAVVSRRFSVPLLKRVSAFLLQQRAAFPQPHDEPLLRLALFFGFSARIFSCTSDSRRPWTFPRRRASWANCSTRDLVLFDLLEHFIVCLIGCERIRLLETIRFIQLANMRFALSTSQVSRVAINQTRKPTTNTTNAAAYAHNDFVAVLSPDGSSWRQRQVAELEQFPWLVLTEVSHSLRQRVFYPRGRHPRTVWCVGNRCFR